MKLLISLFIVTSLSLHANVTVPSSATARQPVVVLTGNEVLLISKLNNQVKDYLATKKIITLNTLGDFIQKEILKTINALYTNFVNEIEKAEKTDVGQSARSYPERSFDYLRLFFNTVDDSLEPLLTTYTTHSSNRALIKQKNSSQKSGDQFNQKEEYYALQRNVFIPLDNCKKVVDKATRFAVSKLLNRVNL